MDPKQKRDNNCWNKVSYKLRNWSDFVYFLLYLVSNRGFGVVQKPESIIMGQRVDLKFANHGLRTTGRITRSTTIHH